MHSDNFFVGKAELVIKTVNVARENLLKETCRSDSLKRIFE
jgi:hypothetical protein